MGSGLRTVAFLDPEGRLEFALGGFLVRAPADRLILIDAGVGPQPVPSWLVRQRSRAESC